MKPNLGQEFLARTKGRILDVEMGILFAIKLLFCLTILCLVIQ